MAANEVTWGIDFWQKVLISVLGTTGSLLIALIVFWLGRRAVRREKARQEAENHLQLERERYHKAGSQVLAQLTDLMVVTSEPVSPEWQERYHSSIRRFTPVASEGLYRFRGTPIFERLREFLELLIKLSEGQFQEAENRLQGGGGGKPFAALLSENAQLLNVKALKLHSDILRALEAIDHVQPSEVLTDTKRRALRVKRP
jgi:hypothetical protein